MCLKREVVRWLDLGRVGVGDMREKLGWSWGDRVRVGGVVELS